MNKKVMVKAEVAILEEAEAAIVVVAEAATKETIMKVDMAVVNIRKNITLTKVTKVATEIRNTKKVTNKKKILDTEAEEEATEVAEAEEVPEEEAMVDMKINKWSTDLRAKQLKKNQFLLRVKARNYITTLVTEVKLITMKENLEKIIIHTIERVALVEDTKIREKVMVEETGDPTSRYIRRRGNQLM